MICLVDPSSFITLSRKHTPTRAEPNLTQYQNNLKAEDLSFDMGLYTGQTTGGVSLQSEE